MRVKLLTDLVKRNEVLKAGTKVDLPDAQAAFLIDVKRAEEIKVKEEKVVKATKELKVKKTTK